MKSSVLISFMIPAVLVSNPIEDVSTWFEDEYIKFRVHPRITRAYALIEDGKNHEARELLNKVIEIDEDNQQAIDMIMNLCIQEKDDACINNYLDKVKDVSNGGYLYAYKAYNAKNEKQYNQAITFAKKAREYDLQEEDAENVTLILFESYLAQGAYRKANHLIDRKNLITYELLKWSQTSDNLEYTDYAYSLAKELPDKKNYIQWRLDLLLKLERHKDASKEMRKLYEIEPTEENLKHLVHLYEITKQNKKMAKLYEKQLTRECNEYALLYLLEYYKKNVSKQRALLERNYPFSCLNQQKQLVLSQKLVKLLKFKNPSKAKRIANNIAKEVRSEQGRILLYQESGQENKIVSHYRSKLAKGCDEYALLYLLDHYTKNERMQRKILEENYPYACLSPQKRSDLTMQLVMALEQEDIKKVRSIVSAFKLQDVNAKHYLNLANIFARLEEYETSKTYALAHLEYSPNDAEALKSVGYNSFKLGQKEYAMEYLMRASKVDKKNEELLKNLGYLSLDLEQPEMAISYWNRYLSLHNDPEVQLELAQLYYNLDQRDNAKKALTRYRSASGKRTYSYYLLEAKMASGRANCTHALKSYDRALALKSDAYVSYEYAQRLKECHQPKKALAILKQLSEEYPDRLLYKKDLAYMYEQHEEYDKAIENFQYVADKEPHKISSYVALANVQKKAGYSDSAVASYKQAVDYARDVNPQHLKQIKHEITHNSSKRFNVYASQMLRLDGDKEQNKGGTYASVPYALYNGFGLIELSYRPRFLGDDITLFGNVIHNHANFKESLQPSLGIRYKPFDDAHFYLSAQQMFEAGEHTRQDTQLRASVGVSNERESSSEVYHNLYLDANYFVDNQSKVFYGNYEVGKEYKLDYDTTIAPYLTTGGSASNDNAQGKTITNLDAGIGIALNHLSGETHYETGVYTNRLKLEARRKYAGNSQDESTIRLQWEFFF
ncbi:MAG TPA: hypothetical protein ENK86_06765 [Campylobacterales bacterium]|nr:hypothetical protein [Campylobacterales bacterium]